LFYEKVKDDLLLKANWTDSDDFEMMFQGTYSSSFYRKLQRFVHKEFRKTEGLQNLELFQKNPLKLNITIGESILKLVYYIPSATFDKWRLKLHENES
jgi:anaerobic magnesium-protoporphyrin IX monomethyl ester cyclase